MNKNERYKAIMEILQREGSVDVVQLAGRFQTSLMTIRRDLNTLCEDYNIVRTHGGAMLKDQAQPVVRVISFDERRIAHREQKIAIAREAAAMIRNGQRIYLDSGSTTRIVLDYLDPETKAVIVCNHLGVAQQALGFKNMSVIMLGGNMIPMSNCSYGEVAEEQIRRYSLDAAFIGAAAIGQDGNLFDGFSPEARLKNYIFDVASRVFLLVDSSKVGTYDVNRFGHLNKIHMVITDDGLDREGRNLISRFDVPLITVVTKKD